MNIASSISCKLDVGRDPAVTPLFRLLHGRTDALLEFLKDTGVILRHLEDRGIFLDRKTLFANRLCKFLHPFVGDTPLVGCRSCSDPLLVVCFTLATRLITAAVWSSFGP